MWEDEVLPGPDYLMNRVQYLLTTTIHRAALIGRAKKVYTSSDILFFTEKGAKKGLHVHRCPLFTENIGETVA